MPLRPAVPASWWSHAASLHRQIEGNGRRHSAKAPNKQIDNESRARPVEEKSTHEVSVDFELFGP